MADNVELFQKVVDKLSRMTAPQNRALSITEDTEVYRDLGIYGDEIVALIWWLEREFGVETNINPFRYAPREFLFFPVRRAIKKLIGLEPKYKSLTVRDLILAIEAKRWPDEASS